MNGKAEFALKRSISHGLFEHIIKCKSANEIWETLDRLYNKKDVSRLQMLENELANATQGELSISQFFVKIKNLCSEISLLDPDEPISEARLRRHIVRGLKPEYTPFITSIQGWAQQPSLEELENLLTSQESLAKQMAGIQVSEGEGEVLLAAGKNFKRKEKKFDWSRGRAESSEKDGRKPIICYRCHKPGHIMKNCKVSIQESNVVAAEKDDQSDEDWGKCFVAETKDIDALASINLEDEWIVDSGCGHHLTSDESKFSNFHQYNGKHAIVTADNSIHSVSKEGKVIINGKDNDQITLNSVFHVPGMKKNLFSVNNAVDSGSFVLFGPKNVKFLKNIRVLDADVIQTGERVKDLYVLLASSSYVEKMSCNDNVSVWHARLGHVNMEKLKVMVQKKLVNGLPNLANFNQKEICEGCQFGKSHRLPFDKSIIRSRTPLECIHGDLFGPTRTPSLSGFRFMLILVDDFTRFTWVYFVKQKSDVLSRFQEFKEMVEGETGMKIRRLRTDNGGEFTSDDFFSFCRQLGIRRQLSCAETPQQNGVTKRKI